MSYMNGKNVLPEKLIQEIQKYVDGQLIYIPRKNKKSISWGEKSGSKEKMAERNRNICMQYDSGVTVAELSKKYYLSEKRIQSIIYANHGSQCEENGFGRKTLKNNLVIRKEEEKDYKETEFMTMRAFWNIHGPGCNEHYMVRLIRKSADYIPEISRVAELNGKIVGAIYYTKAKTIDDNDTHDIITFGPLAVEPTCFGMGIGKALLQETIALARNEEYSGIVLAGEPYYYPKFGFLRCDDFGISDANGNNYDALMCLPLRDDFSSVHGRLMESPVYEEACSNEEAVEKMNTEFPVYPKIKMMDGFLQIFEKHMGVIHAVYEDSFQIKFWELLIVAHLGEEMERKPKVGDNVLFTWKVGEEAVITDMFKNIL